MLDVKQTDEESISKASDKDDTLQERLILNTFPLILQTVKKCFTYSQQTIEDISQKVLINLWKWSSKDTEHNLSENEWKKVAVRAAQNEVRLFYRRNKKRIESTDYLEELTTQPEVSYSQIEGNTNKEINSLAVWAWKEIQQLSLRQKYALLLQKQELIFYLVGCGCCQIEEIADCLQLSKERFIEIFQLLPISDEEISQIFFEVTNENLSCKQIWEARSKARVKLSKVLK